MSKNDWFCSKVISSSASCDRCKHNKAIVVTHEIVCCPFTLVEPIRKKCEVKKNEEVSIQNRGSVEKETEDENEIRGSSEAGNA